MPLPLFDNPLCFDLAGLLGGVFGFRIGWRSCSRFAQPTAQEGVDYLVFAVASVRGRAVVAAFATSGRAIGVTVCSVIVSKKRNARIDQRAIGASDFCDPKRSWLETDRSLSLRVPSVVRVRVRVPGVLMRAVFAMADSTSFIVAAMWHTVLNGYVAFSLLAACDPRTVRRLAWDGWNALRAARLIMFGSASAAPVASGLGYAVPAAEIRWFVCMSGIGLALGLILEWMPSGPCRRLLPRAAMLVPVAERG